jgi:hypothetical protein
MEMKFLEDRPLATPEAAERKLLEIDHFGNLGTAYRETDMSERALRPPLPI